MIGIVVGCVLLVASWVGGAPLPLDGPDEPVLCLLQWREATAADCRPFIVEE